MGGTGGDGGGNTILTFGDDVLNGDEGIDTLIGDVDMFDWHITASGGGSAASGAGGGTIVTFGNDVTPGKPGYAGIDVRASWRGKGNISLGDGSVQRMDNERLRNGFTQSGVTNKLGLPD